MNSLCLPNAGNNIYIAAITGVEVVAALARRQHASSVKDVLLTQALQQFRDAFAVRYRVIEIKLAIISLAMVIAEKHALRGYDAVQLATSVALNSDPHFLRFPFTLVSADNELNLAAQKENLQVENPNNHS